MKTFSFRNFVAALLIFISSLAWAENGATADKALENDMRKFYQALLKNDVNEIKSRYSDLLRLGSRLNWDFENWMNPLFYAIRNSDSQVVEFLLELPSSPDWLKQSNFIGYTIISATVQSRNLELLKKIMALPEMERLLIQKDNSGLAPFQLAVQLGRIEIFQFLLEYPQVQAQLAIRTRSKQTLLHLAVYSGSLDVVKIIFSLPEVRALIFEKDFDGSTVLDLAVSRIHELPVFNFVLSLPESLQLVSEVDEKGNSILHRAPPKAFMMLARYLGDRTNDLHLLKAKNRNGRSPLHELFTRDVPIDMTEFFSLKFFESLLAEKNSMGQNLMHVVAQRNKIQTALQIARLAKNPKQLFDEPDNDGTSPLGLAVRLGRIQLVGALLAEGVDFENVLINNERVSAIEYLSRPQTGENVTDKLRLLRFLLSRQTQDFESQGWSELK